MNNLDDDVFNKLPPQPPKRKPRSPNKQKGKTPPEDEPPTTSGATASSHPSTSVTSQDKSEKALFLENLVPDHTPEEPNVWCDIMKLAGTKRNNQIADGFCQWLNKNYDSGIHEVLYKNILFLPQKTKHLV